MRSRLEHLVWKRRERGTSPAWPGSGWRTAPGYLHSSLVIHAGFSWLGFESELTVFNADCEPKWLECWSPGTHTRGGISASAFHALAE